MIVIINNHLEVRMQQQPFGNMQGIFGKNINMHWLDIYKMRNDQHVILLQQRNQNGTKKTSIRNRSCKHGLQEGHFKQFGWSELKMDSWDRWLAWALNNGWHWWDLFFGPISVAIHCLILNCRIVMLLMSLVLFICIVIQFPI